MSHKQLTVRPEAQAGRFHRISQVRWFVTIDDILMAVEFLFGCWHCNLSRPFTLSGWTYEVCLNCGKKFAYNRVKIGCGVPTAKKGGPGGPSWDDDHTRVSLLPEMRQERMRLT